VSQYKKVRALLPIAPPGFIYRKLEDGKIKEIHDIIRVGEVFEVQPEWDKLHPLGDWHGTAVKNGIVAECSQSERVDVWPQNGAFSDGPSRTKKQNPISAKADRDNKHGDGSGDEKLD